MHKYRRQELRLKLGDRPRDWGIQTKLCSSFSLQYLWFQCWQLTGGDVGRVADQNVKGSPADQILLHWTQNHKQPCAVNHRDSKRPVCQTVHLNPFCTVMAGKG